MSRRFPPPWSVEEQAACFTVSALAQRVDSLLGTRACAFLSQLDLPETVRELVSLKMRSRAASAAVAVRMPIGPCRLVSFDTRVYC